MMRMIFAFSFVFIFLYIIFADGFESEEELNNERRMSKRGLFDLLSQGKKSIGSVTNSTTTSSPAEKQKSNVTEEEISVKKEENVLQSENKGGEEQQQKQQGEDRGSENLEELKSDRSLLGDIAKNLAMLIGFAQKLVKEVNEKAKTWEAAITKFANFTRAEKEKLMGFKMDLASQLKPSKEDEKFLKAVPTTSIPKEFDARKKWSACATVIGAIPDQSSCGSCWAVSTASAFNDRLCIEQVKANKPVNTQVRYSAMDLMSCDTRNHGCDGGVPYYAWDYITKSGIVSGSEWTAKQGCKPYPFAPKQFKDNQNKVITPKCSPQCTNAKYTTPYTKDKKFASKPVIWSGPGLEAKIQAELMANGPVIVGMVVHEDLMLYKGGVYTHVTGASLGGHAVRIIGWGEDRGVKYWLVANSWNTDWGEKGFFRIRRGTDEERIESFQIAFGTPKI